VDFGAAGSDPQNPVHSSNCRHQYGYVVDKTARSNVSICGGANDPRNSIVYRSSSNVVEVVFNYTSKTSSGGEEHGMFVLRFTCTI